jgi:hypothetical protein
MSQLEVVEVRYDPKVLDYRKLAELAHSEECATLAFAADAAQAKTASKVFGERVRQIEGRVTPDKEPKYYLSKSPFAYLPMTELQAVRINASLQHDPERFLSPRQRELLAVIREHTKASWPSAIGVDLRPAWDAASVVRDEIQAGARGRGK